LWLAAASVLPSATDAHGLAQAALLAVLISGGMAIYGLLLGSFGVVKWDAAVAAVRQTAATGLRD
jgi:putative peptidoglycan lipid II flippase